MNREEIEKLEGRELDALVAEKIFGWKWDKDEETGDPFLYGPDVFWAGVKAVPIYWPTREPRSIKFPRDKMLMDYYSTDIAAAWEVVEKMVEKFQRDEALNIPIKITLEEGYWHCYFGLKWFEDGTYYRYSMRGITAPLAICRAALLAVS